MITGDHEFYTVPEAARLLRVSQPTIWRWIRSGRLAAVRVGRRAVRIRREDLERALSPRPVALEEVGAGAGGAGPANGLTPSRPIAPEEILERYAIHLGDPDVDQLALVGELERRVRQQSPSPIPSVDLIREAREARYRVL
jgi:excisionase family DNA binding protein